MYIFKEKRTILGNLKEKPFKLERDIQQLFEKNLQLITDLKLIKSEFAIKNNRIDTLAFDHESKSFVIIEYKRSQNYSVIDQGVSYLNLMLEYKADFIIEYNESHKGELKRNDVDWSQTKIIFVSPSFTEFQRQSSNFKDLAIELWEIKQFEHDIVVIHPIKKSKSAPSIKQVQQNDNSEISKIAKEIKVYTEEDHLEGKTDDIKEMYESYKQAILNLSSEIEIEPKKVYIAFKKGKNIVDIRIQKRNLMCWINLKKGTLEDPKNIVKDCSTKGHYGNGDYELSITSTKDLEYIMSLIKQAIV